MGVTEWEREQSARKRRVFQIGRVFRFSQELIAGPDVDGLIECRAEDAVRCSDADQRENDERGRDPAT